MADERLSESLGKLFAALDMSVHRYGRIQIERKTSHAYRITQAARAGWNVPADDPDYTPEHIDSDPA